MNCRYLSGPPWICAECGHAVKVRSPQAPIRQCDGQPIEARSEAQQAPLIAICQACEHFLPAQASCAKCGCRQVRANLVSERLRAGHCPLGKW